MRVPERTHLSHSAPCSPPSTFASPAGPLTAPSSPQSHSHAHPLHTNSSTTAVIGTPHYGPSTLTSFTNSANHRRPRKVLELPVIPQGTPVPVVSLMPDASQIDVRMVTDVNPQMLFKFQDGRVFQFTEEILEKRSDKFFAIFRRQFQPTERDMAHMKMFRRRLQLRRSSRKGRREVRERQEQLQSQLQRRFETVYSIVSQNCAQFVQDSDAYHEMMVKVRAAMEAALLPAPIEHTIVYRTGRDEGAGGGGGGGTLGARSGGNSGDQEDDESGEESLTMDTS